MFSTTNQRLKIALGGGVDPIGMPLFVCAGCSMRIERSMATYLRMKGRVQCSTCLDRMEAEQKKFEPFNSKEPTN